jgi:hypothetical protein
VNSMWKSLLFTAIVFCSTAVFSRDINLDSQYFKKDSETLQRLTELKLDTYISIESAFVDKDVIFAGWLSGAEVVFIREYAQSDLNVVCRYSLSTRTQVELFRFGGAVTYAKSSMNGHYLFIKKVNNRIGNALINEMLIYDFKKGMLQKRQSQNFLLDFTLSYFGESVIIENKSGLSEFFPDTAREKTILPATAYDKIRYQNQPILGFPSPNKKFLLVLCGGGGAYSALIFKNGQLTGRIQNITSASEVGWLDENTLVYRSGYSGGYSVTVYDAAVNSAKTIGNPSLDTNIVLSPRSSIVAFTEDGTIAVYENASKKLSRYLFEGQDVAFSPAGNEFLSLYAKKLFIAKRLMIPVKSTLLKAKTEEILKIYIKAGDNKSEWDNDYTPEYIKRKEVLYQFLNR